MRIFPRGSEWRKWDLHLHVPGTKLNDGYGGPHLEQFCHALEASDVDAFGITDYFSVDAFFELHELYGKLYPDSQKVLFPNIELRLPDVVNRQDEVVDVHLILRPDVSQDTARQLLGELETEITVADDRHLRCSELRTPKHFESATVSRAAIGEAIHRVFGAKARRDDHVIVIVPANNNGIRPASGKQRRASISDEIDKTADAFFGSAANVDYYLSTDRYEDKSLIARPKPVFACSDAHSYQQFKDWLGQTVTTKDTQKQVTWIKADLTFEGLQQTLIEPAERVRIQSTRPDFKEPYKVISAVRFGGASDFPEEIPLNPNLVSIIGSRSTGKSALLAYMSHAVDPEYTIQQQLGAHQALPGPGAGLTWKSVEHIRCEVVWASDDVTSGKVIYVPQNSLNAISERADEITAKIEPVLFRLNPDFQPVHRQALSDTQAANAKIRSAIEEWFRLKTAAGSLQAKIRDLGDPTAIGSTIVGLDGQIAALSEGAQLSAEDVTTYQTVLDRIGDNERRLATVDKEAEILVPFVAANESAGYSATQRVGVQITPTPHLDDVPAPLADVLRKLIADAKRKVDKDVADAFITYRLGLDQQSRELAADTESLRQANSLLIARYTTNQALDMLTSNRQHQLDVLAEIGGKREKLDECLKRQQQQVGVIADAVRKRTDTIDGLLEALAFPTAVPDDMQFGVEAEVDGDSIEEVSKSFNHKVAGPYVDRATGLAEWRKAQADPGSFLEAVTSGTQKLKANTTPRNVAVQVLCLTPAIRFFAVMDGDRIGGFVPSSMTPGKRALFALSLILNEAQESWPLLIDQPEDDLDSRSIYDTVVPYLIRRKRERQIIMVSHNANTVIGADSEQVIVANRHGDDRKNRNERTFDYLTGSLEHSAPESDSPHVLESCGIREHACKILDGGEAAFSRRGSIYKL